MINATDNTVRTFKFVGTRTVTWYSVRTNRAQKPQSVHTKGAVQATHIVEALDLLRQVQLGTINTDQTFVAVLSGLVYEIGQGGRILAEYPGVSTSLSNEGRLNREARA